MKKILMMTIVFFGTLGLLLLIIDMGFIQNDNQPLLGLTIFKYFSFQSNFMVVVYFLICLTLYLDKTNIVFKNLIGMLFVCISITFIVYLIFLEPIIEYQGIQGIGYILTHYVVPPLTIGYIIYYRKDYDLNYKDIRIWIMYLTAYLFFLIFRGLITDDYIYPFFQISEVGISGFIIMTLIIYAQYILLSFLIVKIVSKK